MNYQEGKVPNLLTVVYRNGKSYNFVLAFDDGQNFKALTEQFSNPKTFEGVLVLSGVNSLHFIPLKEVIQFYYSVYNEKQITALQSTPHPNVDTVTGIRVGIVVPKYLVPEEIKPVARVKDIPKQ